MFFVMKLFQNMPNRYSDSI